MQEKIQQNFNFRQGICGLEIIKEKGKATVVLTEISNNRGISITSAFENIATQVYQKFLPEFSIEDITWVEHYNKNSYRRIKGCPETFDQVTLSWNPKTQEFYDPQWQPYLQNLSAKRSMTL